jgi:hypothetical protein
LRAETSLLETPRGLDQLVGARQEDALDWLGSTPPPNRPRSTRRSDADDLRHVLEVAVAVVQPQAVLQHERRDPEVVRRNRRSLDPELAAGGGVVVRGGEQALGVLASL